jgi:hypothetical protein
MLSVVMLNVIMMNDFMLNYFMLNDFMLSVSIHKQTFADWTKHGMSFQLWKGLFVWSLQL